MCSNSNNMSTDKHSPFKSIQSNKKHRCEFCNKEFKSSSALVIHRRSHTGMRPYKCPFCSRAFSQMTGIQHHIRTHTGERPYMCNICHFKFSRSDSLARHMKKRHSGVQNGLGKKRKKTSEISKKQLLVSYHNNSHSDPSTSQLRGSSVKLNGFLDIPTELQSSNLGNIPEVHITDDSSENSHIKSPNETHFHNKAADSLLGDKKYIYSRIQSTRLRTKSMDKKKNSSYSFSNCNLPEFRYSEVAHQRISVPQNEISGNNRKNYKSSVETSLPQSKVNKRCNFNPNISYTNDLDNVHFKNVNDVSVSSEIESRLHNKLDNYQYANRKNPDAKYGKYHKCFFCFKCFASKSALSIHKRIHTGIRPYVCKMCGRSFTQKTGLRHHYRTHTQERPYKCTICFYAFARSDSLLRHTKLRHKKLKKKAPVYNKQLRKPPECYPNSEHFSEKSSSFKQMVLQHGNNNLFENGRLVEKNVNNLDIHEYALRNNTSSSQVSVVDSNLLIDPLMTVSDEINYGRHHVQSTDLENNSLSTGLISNTGRPEITRTNSPIYITDDEEVSDIISFSEKNENVHAIKSCPKPSTNSKSTMGKYGTKRNLPCSFCHKTFSSFSVLKVHRRIHTGVRPYRCKFCSRSFTQQTGLTHHLRTHTGEKPYSCGNCNAQFSRSDSLARHWRQQHLKQSHIKTTFSIPRDNYPKQKNRTRKEHVSSNSADKKLSISAKVVGLSESETNVQKIDENNPCTDQINFASVVIKSEVSNDETVPSVICDTSKDAADITVKLKTDDLSPTWRRDNSYRDDGNFRNEEIETFQPLSNSFTPSNESNTQQKCSSCKKVFNDKTLLSSHVCEVNTEYQCFLCDMNFNNTILLAEHVTEQHNLRQNCKREGELSQFSFEDEFGSLVEMVITHNNDRDVCRIYLSDFSENTQTIEMNMGEKMSQNITDIWDSAENKNVEVLQNIPNDCDSKANIFCQTNSSTGNMSNSKDSSEDILQVKLEQDQQEFSDIAQNKSSFESFCLTNQEEEFQDSIEPNANPLDTQTSGISSEASNFLDNGCDAGIGTPLIELNHFKIEDADSSTAQLNKDCKETRNKQRQCEYCNKSFNSKWALIIHRRSHTGEKPYECGHCGRGFSQLSGVQHHILTHTGERPFQCKVCHFRFARSDSLVRHIRLKHSECAKEIGSIEEPKKTSALSNNQSLVGDLRNAYSTDVLDMEKNINNNCIMIESMLQDKHLINLTEYPLLLSSQDKEPDTGENIVSNSEDYNTLKDIHKQVDFEKDIKNCNMLELPLSPSKDICAKQIKTFDCKFCGNLFTNSDVLLQHLMQNHSSEIILNDIKETDIVPKSGSEQSKNTSQDSLSISDSTKEILAFHVSNASSFAENCLQRDNIFHPLKEYDIDMVTENSSTSFNREESNPNFSVNLKYITNIENVETIPLDRLEPNGDEQEMDQSRNRFQNIIDITETDFNLKETCVDGIITKAVNGNEEKNHKDVDGNVEDDDDDDVICISPGNFSSYQVNSSKSFAEDFDVTEQQSYEVSYLSATDSTNMSSREITDQSNRSSSCRFCGKSFPTQSALKVHQRTHTGLRPYKCPTCGRAFTQKVGLQHHVRTHTGERPYQCKYCIQKFARSDSLGRHIRYKHLKATKNFNSVSNIQESHVSPLSFEPDTNQAATKKMDINRGISNQPESSLIESKEHSSSTDPIQKDFVMMTPSSFGNLFVSETINNHDKNNLNECFQEYISYSRFSGDNHIDRNTLDICDKMEERTHNSSYSIPNASLLQSSGNTLGSSSDTILLEEMSINISDSECNSPEQNTTVKYESDLTCDICCKEFSNSHLLIKHLKGHINARKETTTSPDRTISAPAAPACYLIDLSDESLEQKTQNELDIELMESDLLSNITKEKHMENKNVTETREINSIKDKKMLSSSLQNLIESEAQAQLSIEKNTDNYQLDIETENANTTASVLSNLISPNFMSHHTNVVSTGIGDNITCSKTNNNSLLVIKDGTRFKLGHKRHVCKYCSKTFASSSALVIHTRTHTGERPYECDYCSRAFSQITGLRHHIRTHTGYKPYSCHFCYYRFARSDSLARHLKLEHQKRNKDSSSRKAVDSIQ